MQCIAGSLVKTLPLNSQKKKTVTSVGNLKLNSMCANSAKAFPRKYFAQYK